MATPRLPFMSVRVVPWISTRSSKRKAYCVWVERWCGRERKAAHEY